MPYSSPPDPTSISRSSTRRPRRMDAAMFEYFDVCALSVMAGDDVQAEQPVAPSKISSVFHTISTRLQSFLPRRLHEPTGPWGLILDMILSLFVAHGACRSVIDALPLEVVGQKPDDCAPQSRGPHINVPVKEGDKCAICLGCYEQGDAVRHLACSHAFHAECVDVWLERKSLCPICKRDTC